MPVKMNDSFSFEKTILVTGSGGQLGMEFWKLCDEYPSYKFLFTTREDLPIDNFKLVKIFFEQQQIHHCINCAAYTAVDKAESEKEKAFLINADAAGSGGQLGMELWKLCDEYPSYKFLFTTREDLPIDNFKLVKIIYG